MVIRVQLSELHCFHSLSPFFARLLCVSLSHMWIRLECSTLQVHNEIQLSAIPCRPSCIPRLHAHIECFYTFFLLAGALVKCSKEHKTTNITIFEAWKKIPPAGWCVKFEFHFRYMSQGGLPVANYKVIFHPKLLSPHPLEAFVCIYSHLDSMNRAKNRLESN